MFEVGETPVSVNIHSPSELVKNLDAQRLFEYWKSLSIGGASPRWHDIDLLSLPALIPNIVVHEVTYDPLVFRMKLLGKHIIEQTGIDRTGVVVGDIEGSNDALKRFEQVVRDKRGYFCAKTPVGWASRDYKSFSSMVLPATDAKGDIDHLLCWVGGFS